MKQVQFSDSNCTKIYCTGFDTVYEAESAANTFLSEQGDEYAMIPVDSDQEEQIYCASINMYAFVFNVTVY